MKSNITRRLSASSLRRRMLQTTTNTTTTTTTTTTTLLRLQHSTWSESWGRFNAVPCNFWGEIILGAWMMIWHYVSRGGKITTVENFIPTNFRRVGRIGTLVVYIYMMTPEI